MMETLTTDIWNTIQDYLGAEKLELDDLEMNGRGRSRVLRVLVDGESVDLDRLADLSRDLSRLLEDEPSLQTPYQLEVSSPGLERKLRRPHHYAKSIGREISVKYRAGEANRNLRGHIAEANETGFVLDSPEGRLEIGFEDVITAKTIFHWERAPKPGH